MDQSDFEDFDHTRWALWKDQDELIIFDRVANVPYEVEDDQKRAQLLRRLSEAGVVVQADYPGRPCS